MRYLSVCSGIEAATVAWHPLGWTPAAFSEIEKFPRAVLQHHYPDVPLHGDFTTIGANEYGPVDLLVGGTPCQSFSIAGLRGGLDDDRGNLALEFLRLADRLRARWVVWENVPGVLSSNGGRDFGSILGGLVELGYGFAYRVLDAQFFGVAQRRRRVFVVGHIGDAARAAAVLFERHSLSGHPAPRREAGEGTPISPALRARANSSHRADSQAFIPAAFGGGNTSGELNVAACLVAKGHKCDFEVETFIAHSLRGEGFDASEDGTGRGTPLVPVHCRDIAGALTSNYGKQPDSSDTALGPNLIAFSAKDYGADAMEDCGPTLRAGGHSGSHANAGVMPAVAFAQNQLGEVRTGEVFNTLNTNTNASGRNTAMAAIGSAVRRLTPRECERLQGFPEVQKCYTILVCRGYSDQQKSNALAALQSRKLRSNAWLADASGWMLSAEAAAHHSSTSHHDRAPLVAVDALTDLERQVVRLHSAGRSFSLASNAGEKSEFPLPTGIDSFARLAALLTHAWALATPDGKAGSQPSINPSSPLWSGSSIAISYGREIGEPAADVATAIEMANRLSTSTTLPSGLDTETLHSTLTTLSSCVVRAIAGSIPETTTGANCFAVRLTVSQGYTLIPWRGKPADECPDGPRYKALGNSMAVPVMRWIGERIQAVEDIAAMKAAA